MGRPPLALGAHGHIDFHTDPGSGRVRARARFRCFDGVCRPVTRWGASRAEAEGRLLAAPAEQAAFPTGDWAAGTRAAAAIRLWTADQEAGSLAPATRQLDEAAVRLYVQPAFGEVRLGELTPAVIDRALNLVRVTKGTQPARAARRTLSSLCADALRHGAISHNPVRDSRPIGCQHRQARALTPAEAGEMQQCPRASGRRRTPGQERPRLCPAAHDPAGRCRSAGPPQSSHPYPEYRRGERTPSRMGAAARWR